MAFLCDASSLLLPHKSKGRWGEKKKRYFADFRKGSWLSEVVTAL